MHDSDFVRHSFGMPKAVFCDCIDAGRRPEVVTLADAAESIRLVEAEVESVHTGRVVEL